MKKFFVVLLGAVLMIMLFAACELEDTSIKTEESRPKRGAIQIGMIVSSSEEELHPTALYKAAQDDDKITVKTGVTDENCYSVTLELANLGCDVIFAAGDGIEDYIVQAATEETDVQFCMANGIQSEQIKLPNLHSYAVKETEARYLAGIAAGMKLNDMIQNGEISGDDIKVGYIGTRVNAENRSAYTAFYLGMKAVCSEVTLCVQYSGAECDAEMEESTAAALIANGCKLIAQHSETGGAAEICAENNVYFVGSLVAAEGEFWVTSTSADWSECYGYALDCIGSGRGLPIWWSQPGGDTTPINKDAFVSEEIYEETKNKLSEAKTALEEGSLKVFDTSEWTVGGETVTSTAGEELWFDYYGEEYIEGGYFREYEYSSQPKFAFVIDGITELN